MTQIITLDSSLVEDTSPSRNPTTEMNRLCRIFGAELSTGSTDAVLVRQQKIVENFLSSKSSCILTRVMVLVIPRQSV